MTDQTTDDWRSIESPVDVRFAAVAETVTGPCIVGPDGVVVGRTDGGLSVAVSDGPAAAANTLLDVAVTAEAERIWVAGSSGAVGAYDVTTGRKYDYSAPGEKTSTWEAVAVSGVADDERLLLANGSGEVLPVVLDDRGCPHFGDVTEPGSGSSITALDFGTDCAYAVDTRGGVYARPATEADWPAPTDDGLRADGAGARAASEPETGDDRLPDGATGDTDGAAGGSELTDSDGRDGPADGTWEWIGIENAQVDFRDVAADGDSLFVAADDGLVYRYDRACRNWTPISVADGSLRGIDVVGDTVVAVGEGGTVVSRTAERGWHHLDAPVEVTLTGVALGTRLYAVGEEGTVVTRGVEL